ncbi:MAG: ABC transporter substrate-binding protein [Muribaculaceae bacterium]|nr:ABC transporter substrate-binding protein [Muribaculaceae bacterium]
MRRLITGFFAGMALAGAIASCGRQSADNSGTPGDTLTSNATLLTIVDHGSYTEAVISDPWGEKGAVMARLALVDRDADVPADADDGILVRVPLTRSAVFSSVHTAPMFELGAGHALTAVADGSYFPPSDTVGILLAEGRVADVGSSSSPSVERLLALDCDAVLLSPMQGVDNGMLARSGIAAIPMADYMEQTPLGRAEWIKLLGILYGCAERADSIYDAVVADYSSMCRRAEQTPARPRVLTENITGGVWYVPAGKSYMARLLSDAGAEYPWSDTDSEGSLSLDASMVLDRASDADVWLIRCYGSVPDYASLRRDNPAAAHIKAFRNKNIYVCDTSRKNIFNDIAFHPERVLHDYVEILHPGATAPDSALIYFERL